MIVLTLLLWASVIIVTRDVSVEICAAMDGFAPPGKSQLSGAWVSPSLRPI